MRIIWLGSSALSCNPVFPSAQSCPIFALETFVDKKRSLFLGRELLWQSLIGRGPRHAIPIFLLENHMVGLIRFVTVHDRAMQSRLSFSSVLPHFCTRNFCGLKKVQFFYLAFNQLHLIVTLAHYSTLYLTVEQK